MRGAQLPRALPLAALALLPAALASQPAPPRGWRATGEAFRQPAQVEVRDLDTAAAEAALRAGMDMLAQAEADSAALTVRLNAAAGRGPVPVEAEALALLRRALDFCLWSERATGPLGGVIFELWQRSLPPAGALAAASQTAACDRLMVDQEAGTARLAAGSRVDLRGFAPGWAVDRAAEVLRGHGATNARIRLGSIERGLGPGPLGQGWTADMDLPREWIQALPEPRLRDRALAVAGREPARVIAGDSYSAHLNLRDGRPAAGVLATIAVSELAVDAQALAATMFVLGQREGMLRLGSLRPEPSVAWLLGSGEAPPLLTTHRWAAAE